MKPLRHEGDTRPLAALGERICHEDGCAAAVARVERYAAQRS